MRRNRHQRDCRKARLQNGTAARQGIGRRAGRGVDDDAVSAQGLDKLAIYFHRKFDHGSHGAPTEHHVIERDRLENGLVATAYFCVQ